MDRIKSIKRASREIHKGMPKGGAIPSKKDKARRRKAKHAKRERGGW